MTIVDEADAADIRNVDGEAHEITSCVSCENLRQPEESVDEESRPRRKVLVFNVEETSTNMELFARFVELIAGIIYSIHIRDRDSLSMFRVSLRDITQWARPPTRYYCMRTREYETLWYDRF